MLSPSGTTSFPAKNSAQRVAGQAGTRSKVALKPGRSLMDWIRLGKSGSDLQGFGGKHHTVTNDELRKHSKESDCWMAIRGKVYNITPYLEYHPGGIPEILRGAGADGTALFDEVHKWVNVESMLSSCLIGPLSTSPKLGKATQNSIAHEKNKGSSKLEMPPPNGVIGRSAKTHGNPWYDWFQNEEIVFISVYTKKPDITEDDVIIDCQNKQTLEAKILLGDNFYSITKELENTVSSIQVKLGEKTSGKVEIILFKEHSGTKWEKLGNSLCGDCTLQKEAKRELKYRQCTLKSKVTVTHDTFLFGVELPERVLYNVPIGHHCLFQDVVEGMEINRSYTVALKSLVSLPPAETAQQRILYFMIKIYQDGVFTSRLGRLQEGDHVMLSDCTGDFKLSRLKCVKDVFLVAAGTGVTPMLRIIRYCLLTSTITSVKLLFANKTEDDILWRSQLDEMERVHAPRFKVQYILSRARDTWTGMSGRINQTLIGDFVAESAGKRMEKESTLYCICGPTQFTNDVQRMMVASGVSENTIHCFLG